MSVMQKQKDKLDTELKALEAKRQKGMSPNDYESEKKRLFAQYAEQTAFAQGDMTPPVLPDVDDLHYPREKIREAIVTQKKKDYLVARDGTLIPCGPDVIVDMRRGITFDDALEMMAHVAAESGRHDLKITELKNGMFCIQGIDAETANGIVAAKPLTQIPADKNERDRIEQAKRRSLETEEEQRETEKEQEREARRQQQVKAAYQNLQTQSEATLRGGFTELLERTASAGTRNKLSTQGNKLIKTLIQANMETFNQLRNCQAQIDALQALSLQGEATIIQQTVQLQTSGPQGSLASYVNDATALLNAITESRRINTQASGLLTQITGERDDALATIAQTARQYQTKRGGILGMKSEEFDAAVETLKTHLTQGATAASENLKALATPAPAQGASLSQQRR